MGYSRRRELLEIAQAIVESNRQIDGITLGQICAAGAVMLEVSCHCVPKAGTVPLNAAYRSAWRREDLARSEGLTCRELP